MTKSKADQQRALLDNAVNLQHAFARLVTSSPVIDIGFGQRNEAQVFCKPDMLYWIEPDPRKWDYVMWDFKDFKWKAYVMYEGVKFMCFLTYQQRLDMEGFDGETI